VENAVRCSRCGAATQSLSEEQRTWHRHRGSVALPTAVSDADAKTEVSCADGSDNVSVTISKSLTIDCAGITSSLNSITVTNGATVVLRNFTMWNINGGIILQSGTVETAQ
jgi:hypothetical protein